MKAYKNLKEVEEDIEIHKLKIEIEEEKLKLHAAELKEELSPRNLITNMLTSVVKGYVFKKLIGRFRGKKRS